MCISKHFEKEFSLLDDDALIIKYKKPIQDIIDIFEKEGHSGFSAGIESSVVSNCIKKLLSFETLTDLTGNDDEWNEVGNDFYQNNRNSAVFKRDGKSTYSYAIVWQGPDEYDTFGGIVDGISSQQYFDFPFTPKTFYVDVVYDSDGEPHIKNWDDLDEVFKMYIRDTNEKN